MTLREFDRPVKVTVVEKNFTHQPDYDYVDVRCECGQMITCDRFPKDMWNEYMKERYNPELPNYCKNCGGRIVGIKEMEE